ncbi:hypothetical protein [Neorhizobium alkalisoli]|jgi:hypothetical protein|uniref:Uncharacterized protein n=1 Tax=Neorhizobium alkalisoli TaxID=528178 RepID=A0A561QCP8_9HYPH|nr:hypothetical protein [Neorhizobium alkalisoli]TWF48061.1 hypothetical protein FHW37_109124 [Neorhizobium alkalisoli]
MSRHNVTVTVPTQTDREVIIGYAPPLRTFFLEAFPDPEADACGLWLGGVHQEFGSLEIHGLGKDAIVGMTKEAGTRTPPSVGKRLGIVQ